MRLLAMAFSFLIEHFDILERNVNNMTKKEYEAYMRIKGEFEKLPKEKLESIRKDINNGLGNE